LNLLHEQILPVLLMGILLMFSAFFSGAETALFSLHSETARSLRRHPYVGPLLAVLRKQPSDLLSAILFGNLIVNLLFFCTGAALSGRWGSLYGEWAEAVGGMLILLAVILLGEIIPKAIGINHASKVLSVISVPLRLWLRITAPFRIVIGWFLRMLRLQGPENLPRVDLTPGELKELIDAVRHEPGFGAQEKEILEDIVDLSDIRVREIMTPRVRVLRKPLHTSRAELLDEACLHEYSRVLIYDENDDDLLGYLCIRDLFSREGPESTLTPLLHPLIFVPETLRANKLLADFMSGGNDLVAVVDEYGGFSGLVTLEDLFSEVVGDLETSLGEQIEALDSSTYRLDGQLSIRSWRELFTGFLPGREMDALAFDTLGGFIISRLGHMPEAGDTVLVRNLRLTVETMHHRRIGAVLLQLLPVEDSK
jgi:CBS domain containing-hemolysin-like protein